MDEHAVPITDHLSELRRRIAWVVATITIGAIFSFNFAEEIFGFLLAPATEALGAKNSKLQAIAPTEIFFTYIKCAVLSGFVLSLPVSFWQLWAFIAPGLYDNERRAIFPFVIFSTGLFAGGAIFGYSLVFPIVFEFFNSWDNEWVVSAWTSLLSRSVWRCSTSATRGKSSGSIIPAARPSAYPRIVVKGVRRS